MAASVETVLRLTHARDTKALHTLTQYAARLEAMLDAWSHVLCAAAFEAGRAGESWPVDCMR